MPTGGGGAKACLIMVNITVERRGIYADSNSGALQ